MPMILMGDEVRRTQRGNNNAYRLDNELSWFDWTLLEKHADVHRFVQLLCARRAMRAAPGRRWSRADLITSRCRLGSEQTMSTQWKLRAYQRTAEPARKQEMMSMPAARRVSAPLALTDDS